MDGARPRNSTTATRICVGAIVLLAGLAAMPPAPAHAQLTPPAWAQPGFDVANTGYNPSETWLSAANVGSLALDWDAPVAEFAAPIVAGGVMYLGCDPGSFCALDATNGALRWKTPVSGTPPQSAALVGDVVYVGGGAPFVEMALDAATGKVLWKTLVTTNETRGPDTPIRVAEGIVVQGSQGRLFAWDAATGIQRWVAAVDADGATAVASGMVFVESNHPPTLHALRASTGETLWTAVVSAGDLGVPPVVAGGLVVVASDRAPGSTTGKISGYKAGGCGSPACQPVWAVETPERTFAKPASANGVLFQGLSDGTYVAVDASTGRKSWTAAVAGPTLVNPGASSPTVANGLLFGATGGFVRAWPAAGCGAPTCQPLWSAPLSEGAWTVGDLVVVHGRLYVVDTSERLRVFSPRVSPPPPNTPPPVPGPVGPGPVRTEPTNLHVPGDHLSIQRAIDASIPGDTVVVAPGTYHERLDFHGRAVEVRSAAGREATVIDGDGVGTVVVFRSGETRASALRGFTIRNASGAKGGAIVIDGASPTIAGNLITGNSGSGAAGILADGGGPAIFGNELRENLASHGNDADVALGGAIWVNAGSGAEVRDNLIEYNYGSSGGGIAVSKSASTSVIGNVIRRNRAHFTAAGAYLSDNTDLVFAQNLVVDNTSFYGAGGVSVSGGATLLANTIAGNTGSSVAGIAVGDGVRITLTANVIAGTPGLPVVWCSSSRAASLDTNIVYNGPYPPLVYRTSPPSMACATQPESVDPRFVDPGGGDYRPGLGSPAIDAGVQSPLLPATDVAGRPRAVDGDGDGVARVDAGAYEAQPPVAAVVPGEGYHPLLPRRLLDTRTGDGAPAQRLGPGQTIDLQVTRIAGVPPVGVSSIVMNVTVTEPTSTSFLTAWPAGDFRPLASNLNYVAGQTVANLVTVKVGQGGKVSLYNNSGSAHVIADVAGWYGEAGARYTALTPSRILDTRAGVGAPPGSAGPGPISLQVTGRGGVPATDVSAVVLNVTVTEPTETGYLTAYPDDGGLPPLASNLNFVPGQTVPNLVVVQVGMGGRVNLYTNWGRPHVIADVAGWFGAGVPAEASFVSLPPARILDTRTGNGAAPVKVGPASKLDLQVTGRGGVPATGVTAVVLNVTVTEPTAGSFLTAWPSGLPRPLASNLNYVAGLTVPNQVVVKVGEGGLVNLYNYAGWTHVIADVAGWYG